MVGFRRNFSLLTLSIIALCATLFYLYNAHTGSRWRALPALPGVPEYLSAAGGQQHDLAYANSSTHSTASSPTAPLHKFPPEPNYIRHLVVAKMKDEEANWLHTSDLRGAIPKIYIPDDPTAALTVPTNKGHEAMVYLTYIIDHYDSLPDVAIFMHAHRQSWHQADLLRHDGVEVIQRLSSARVLREGYMNLRCDWNPGCPAWLHPLHVDPKSVKVEEPVMAQAWRELFPGRDVPEVLAQPCCAQFAVSRDRVRALGREEYVRMREWLIDTRLEDDVSGRVFEYLWQVVFGKGAVVCPDMHVCYCDGYGLCFEDEGKFDLWFELRWERKLKEEALEEWWGRVGVLERLTKSGGWEGEDVEALELKIPSVEKGERLRKEIEAMEKVMEEARLKAIERGRDPKVRALVAGREWKQGDGF